MVGWLFLQTHSLIHSARLKSHRTLIWRVCIYTRKLQVGTTISKVILRGLIVTASWKPLSSFTMKFETFQKIPPQWKRLLVPETIMIKFLLLRKANWFCFLNIRKEFINVLLGSYPVNTFMNLKTWPWLVSLGT